MLGSYDVGNQTEANFYEVLEIVFVTASIFCWCGH